MESITFVNVLTVPAAREEEFVAKWDKGAAYVRTCKGFVSTSLHRALGNADPLRFFTIAAWESADDFRAATSTGWWRDFAEEFGFGEGAADFKAEPSVCRQIR